MVKNHDFYSKNKNYDLLDFKPDFCRKLWEYHVFVNNRITISTALICVHIKDEK